MSTNGTIQRLTTTLNRCKSLLELKQIHALVITSKLSQDSILMSKILAFTSLSSSPTIDYSFQILSTLSNPTTFNWNTVIRGCSNSKNPNDAISVFIKMLRLGLSPDYLTYPFLLKASARLLSKKIGPSIHAQVLKFGFELDRYIANSLIHMYGSFGDSCYSRKVLDEMLMKNLVSWNCMVDCYGKCGNMVLARELFDSMIERDVVSWSCLIDGYVKSGDYEIAIEVFEEMLVSGFDANEVTMVSVLSACAHLGALDKGQMMHHYMVENGLLLTLVLRTSLVDMYAKCGAIEEALSVFREACMRKTDVLIWNAMLGGFATHGYVKESLDLFTEMQLVGIKPDEITYLCLLSCCAHNGLVNEAWHFFECLGNHGMAPKSEHYACMVDAMARAGRVTEAYQFVCDMPNEQTASMLGALLNGCIKHRKFDLAEIVGKKLIELQPDHDGRYVGLSNVYAIGRRWDEAKSMREAMERRGLKKCPGFSFLETSEAVHRFIAHDKTHPCSDKIYMILKFIVNEMKPRVDSERNSDWSLNSY